jgi:hypothetical protein
MRSATAFNRSVSNSVCRVLSTTAITARFDDTTAAVTNATN